MREIANKMFKIR